MEDQQWDCPRCGETFKSDFCLVCGYEVKETDKLKRIVGSHREYSILNYEKEKGVRVDFGTMRSKLVEDIEDAKKLIDYYLFGDDEMNTEDKSLHRGIELIVEGYLVGGSIREGTFEIEYITGRKNYIKGHTDPDLLKGKAFGKRVKAVIQENEGKYTLVKLDTN